MDITGEHVQTSKSLEDLSLEDLVKLELEAERLIENDIHYGATKLQF